MRSGNSQDGMWQCPSGHWDCQKKWSCVRPEALHSCKNGKEEQATTRWLNLGINGFLNFRCFHNIWSETELKTLRQKQFVGRKSNQKSYGYATHQRKQKVLRLNMNCMTKNLEYLEAGKQETRNSQGMEPKKLHTCPPGLTSVNKKRKHLLTVNELQYNSPVLCIIAFLTTCIEVFAL